MWVESCISLTCYVDNQSATVNITAKSDIGSDAKKTEISIAHFNISTALLTPFHADDSLDLLLLSAHANDTLKNGASGVTLFGTTGEGASIGFNERSSAISALLESGIEAQKITLGLCGSAIADVLAQVEQGVAVGIMKFLLLPPFYFKGLSDDGLFEWHSKLFEAADSRATFILYHIPQVTNVPLSLDLVLRLRGAFGDRILAIKDSEGNWANSLELLESKKIPVLIGDERILHKAAALGAVGSICGLANLYPQRVQAILDTHEEDVALSADVDLIVSVPVIAALKQIMVAKTGEANWGRLRSPLEPLSGEAKAAIAARFPSSAFS